jgi:sterol desaturase/sphingolipid hydroxylase (fatty acid hydroxylase superfamily)
MRSPTLGSVAVGLLLLSLVFGLLERRFAALPRESIWRRSRWTDLAYWFFTPLVTRVITRGAAALAVAVAAVGFGLGVDPRSLLAGIQAASPIARWPAAVQLLLALLVADLVAYWMHRLFHRRTLWRFHAIHHSARTLDWLAATRLHPVNDALSHLALAAPLVLLGFDLRVLAAVAPIASLYAIFLHANLPWDLGPLRYVIATPAFHRWHHSVEPEARDKNFAGLFPVLDLLFGTFHMPPQRQPTEFGVGEPVPEGLFGQLVYPFRRRGVDGDAGRAGRRKFATE